MPKGFLQLFPLAIPASAVYVGDAVVNNIKCEQWSWDTDSYMGVDAQIIMSVSSDGLIQQIVMNKIEFIASVTWHFTNMAKGAPASKYAPPKIQCPPVFNELIRPSPVKLIRNALSLFF